MRPAPSDDVGALVDRLFRRESGRIVAALARSLGAGRLDLAEDLTQQALLQALRVWPYRGVPDDPAAWLFTAARRLAIDAARRDASLRRHADAIERELMARAPAPPRAHFVDELADDELRLLFMCAHPALSAEMRLALILRVGCGLSTREIAAGVLREEATVAQWLVRARKRVQERGLSLDMPSSNELPSRLAPVLDALYLAFNEGHGAATGDALVRADICGEAVRLARLIADHAVAGRPEVQALAALLLFHLARLPTRTDAAGEIVLLADQDRACWDAAAIAEGFARLQKAATGERLSEFHLLAGIAAEHARAATFEDTDWPSILAYYDTLVAIAPSPVHRLNRAVAVAMTEGAARGLNELDALAGEKVLADYFLLPATRGELLRRLGRHAEASAALAEATRLTASAPARRFLARRLDELASP
ncbi:MAG: sigma-70 family RNA polymerase sigma factor [Alphaproteobacteria bacterium]|nr:sigma-70 family RNA polymerase sigma factor [Alphaproteobacteria bacterium]